MIHNSPEYTSGTSELGSPDPNTQIEQIDTITTEHVALNLLQMARDIRGAFAGVALAAAFTGPAVGSAAAEGQPISQTLGNPAALNTFAASDGNKYINAPSSNSAQAKAKAARLRKNCLEDPLYVAQSAGKSRDKNKFGASMRVVNLTRSGKVVPGRVSPADVAAAPEGKYRQKFIWRHGPNFKVCGVEATFDISGKEDISLFKTNRKFFPRPDKVTATKGSWTDAWVRGAQETRSFQVYLKRR